MRKLLLLFLLSIVGSINAQIINFTDANFKAKLLEANTINSIAGIGWDGNSSISYIKIDSNNNGEIEESEAAIITSLYIGNSDITDLTGINYFSNLRFLDCSNQNVIENNNQISHLDITSLINLVGINCSNNQIASLNILGLNNLRFLGCAQNQLSSLNILGLNLERILCANNSISTLDFTGMSNLNVVWCENNQLAELDFSTNPFLYSLYCANNNLNFINLKNGYSFPEIISPMSSDGFINNPDLQYICADENEALQIQSELLFSWGQNIQVNSYCSFTPGGTYYTIEGNVKLDSNNNGCDVLDINFPFQKFSATDGTYTFYTIADASGNYSISVPAGNYTLTPIIENSNFFTISPANTTVSFPATTSPFIQNFCLQPNGVHNDLEIVLHANQARPGFDCDYFITYKNNGNTIQNGSVSLTFNDDVLDYVTANPNFNSQSATTLQWNFANLQPFETRTIIVTFNSNTPTETPSLNGGDILNFTATIVGATDENPENNLTVLNQAVVNSYDPNHKTCLEGNSINPTMVGKEVHYKIEFENNGSANAQNVVIKDMIDTSKYDLNSLFPLLSSHSFVTKIETDGKVEFIFKNINLPFDDANNDGYIVFKIKTLPTLSIGDTFSNTANIYFDYNFPIVTNTATTSINALSNLDFSFNSYFDIYPNPTTAILNVKTKLAIAITSINVYNNLGQVVMNINNNEKFENIDVSCLKVGTYFIKINTDIGSLNSKFVKI